MPEFALAPLTSVSFGAAFKAFAAGPVSRPSQGFSRPGDVYKELAPPSGLWRENCGSLAEAAIHPQGSRISVSKAVRMLVPPGHRNVPGTYAERTAQLWIAPQTNLNGWPEGKIQLPDAFALQNWPDVAFWRGSRAAKVLLMGFCQALGAKVPSCTKSG